MSPTELQLAPRSTFYPQLISLHILCYLG